MGTREITEDDRTKTAVRWLIIGILLAALLLVARHVQSRPTPAGGSDPAPLAAGAEKAADTAPPHAKPVR